MGLAGPSVGAAPTARVLPRSATGKMKRNRRLGACVCARVCNDSWMSDSTYERHLRLNNPGPPRRDGQPAGRASDGVGKMQILNEHEWQDR